MDAVAGAPEVDADPPEADNLVESIGTRSATRSGSVRRKSLKKKKRVRIRIKTAAVPVPLSEGEAREERAAIKMQRAYRRKMFVSMVEKLLLSTRRRGDLLRELVATEKTYVKCLDQLVEQFVVPLSAKLSETELLNVFPRVTDLRKLHKHVLERLSELMASPQRNFDRISQIFSDMARKALDAYSVFLQSFDKAALVLKRLLEGNATLDAMVERIASPSGHLKGVRYLNELMVTPMQRLPRYELLFKELIACSMVHDDFPALKTAYEDIKQATTLINDRKRISDDLFRKSFLEQHASREVLAEHVMQERETNVVYECGKCEKNIWGLAQRTFKCQQCRTHFHPRCARELRGIAACVQRKRLELSDKRLIFQREAFLFPHEEPVARERYAAAVRTSALAKSPPARVNRSSSAFFGGAQASRSGPTPVLTVKALLLAFEDGLVLAYQYSYDHDTSSATVDVIGEAPWKHLAIRAFTSTEPDRTQYVLSLEQDNSTKWSYWLPTKAECDSLTSMMDDVRRQASEAHLGVGRLSSADMRMTLLMKDH